MLFAFPKTLKWHPRTQKGDSGGPIFTSKGVQVGISSWSGADCGDNTAKSVYARISGVYPWMRDTVCELSDTNPDFCPAPRKPTAKVAYFVVIQYDRFPRETGIKIVDVKSRNVVFSRPKKARAKSPNRKTPPIKVALRPGRSYRLVMEDTNGFCCARKRGKKGFVAVSIKRGGKVVVVKKGGKVVWPKKISGLLRGSKSTTFKVPRVLGSSCTKNSHCPSGPCVNKICQPGKVRAGDRCDKDSDCANGVCAHGLDSKRSPKICCPSADFWKFGNLGKYPYTCAIPLGDRCSSTRQCLRGSCVSSFGRPKVCQLINNGNSCEHDKDCKSIACSSLYTMIQSFPPLTALPCPLGWTYQCAHQTISAQSPFVCCEEYYKDKSLLSKDWPYGCKLPPSASCMDDKHCLSGVCTGAETCL